MHEPMIQIPMLVAGIVLVLMANQLRNRRQAFSRLPFLALVVAGLFCIASALLPRFQPGLGKSALVAVVVAGAIILAGRCFLRHERA
jgi:cell division protein FtsW (lipid II flippase)